MRGSSEITTLGRLLDQIDHPRAAAVVCVDGQPDAPVAK
jgi:hypothetical protein